MAAKGKTSTFFTIMTLIVMVYLCVRPPAASCHVAHSKTRYDFLAAQNLKTALGGIRKKSAFNPRAKTTIGPVNTGVKRLRVTTIALGWTVEFNRPNLAGGPENQTFDRSAPAASIGNIVGITGGDYAGARIFNDIHQLTSIGGNVQQFDGVGNLTTSATGTTFDWDIGAGRLTSTTVDNDPRGITGTHNYGYDAMGRRAWKEVGGNKTVFIYSGPNIIAEYNAGSSATSPGNEYIYSGGIDSLAMVAFNNNSKRLVAHRNQQWSIVGLVDFDNQTLEEQYAYNVFGQRTILDNVGTVRTTSNFNNRYGYTSREHDDETGMMYFRARYYDTMIGEFISQDPLEYVDGYSVYRGYFVMNGVDPTGQCCNPDIKRTISIDEDCEVKTFKGIKGKFYGFKFSQTYEFKDPKCECCEYRQYKLSIVWTVELILVDGSIKPFSGGGGNHTGEASEDCDPALGCYGYRPVDRFGDSYPNNGCSYSMQDTPGFDIERIRKLILELRKIGSDDAIFAVGFRVSGTLKFLANIIDTCEGGKVVKSDFVEKTCPGREFEIGIK